MAPMKQKHSINLNKKSRKTLILQRIFQRIYFRI